MSLYILNSLRPNINVTAPYVNQSTHHPEENPGNTELNKDFIKEIKNSQTIKNG